MQTAVAGILAGSSYTEANLLSILWEEVHPVCLPNLLNPAGEWAAFDLEWLTDQILMLPRGRKWLGRLIPGRRMVNRRAQLLMNCVTDLRAVSARPEPSYP